MLCVAEYQDGSPAFSMDLDARYADRVIGILAASIERAEYGDLFGIGSGLLASLGAIGHQLPELMSAP